MFLIGAVIGGGIGYLMNDLVGMFLGIIAGGIIFGIVPLIKSSGKPAPPAQVSVVAPPAPQASPAPRRVPLAERLAGLEEAKTKGFLTQDEYARKKAQILDEA